MYDTDPGIGKRLVEVLTGTVWVKASLEHIKTGDTFRMFEPDGKPVCDEYGHSQFTAESNAYLINEVWGVNANGRYEVPSC